MMADGEDSRTSSFGALASADDPLRYGATEATTGANSEARVWALRTCAGPSLAPKNDPVFLDLRTTSCSSSSVGRKNYYPDIGGVMKIAVDPGHGMSNATMGVFDSGAVARAHNEIFREADFTLRYGLSLKDIFRSRGVEVFMTRDDQEDPAPVGQRAGNAERAGCEVFVSLHMNSSEASSANGLEVLFRDDADAAFAKAMHDGLVDVTGLRPRGTPRRNNLAVLRFDGPAILIELGFITNTRDRTELLSPETRARVCAKIADIVIARFGAGTSAGMAASRVARLSVSAPYMLPAYARASLGESSSISWSSANPFPDFNFYSGIVPGSFHRFPATSQLTSGALFYEAKFAIDGDGSGGNSEGDPTHQVDTSLHDAQGRPLNSRRFPFIVLPLRHNRPGRPQWSELGVELGDLGVCFFKNGASCAVLFGDSGPAVKLGEGSMVAAEMLGIDSDPNVGGIDAGEIPPGILHFVFPGSRKVQHIPGERPRTEDTPASVSQRAWDLFRPTWRTCASRCRSIHRNPTGAGHFSEDTGGARGEPGTIAQRQGDDRARRAGKGDREVRRAKPGWSDPQRGSEQYAKTAGGRTGRHIHRTERCRGRSSGGRKRRQQRGDDWPSRRSRARAQSVLLSATGARGRNGASCWCGFPGPASPRQGGGQGARAEPD